MGIWGASSYSSYCPHILHIAQQIPLYQHQNYYAFYLHSTLTPCHPFSTELNHSATIIILFSNFKSNSYTSSSLSLIHPFRFPRMYKLYPLPPLSIILSMPFQDISLSSTFPSIGAVSHHHTKCHSWKLEFIQRILELTHLNFITALSHTSCNSVVTSSLALSISWTPTMMIIIPQHNTSPFPFNFVSVKANNSNSLFLKTSTTPSLFTVLFIPLTFHLPNRFTQLYRAAVGDTSGSVRG